MYQSQGVISSYVMFPPVPMGEARNVDRHHLSLEQVWAHYYLGLLHRSVTGKIQSKAHFSCANRKSNTYNLTLSWSWPWDDLDILYDLDRRSVKLSYAGTQVANLAFVNVFEIYPIILILKLELDTVKKQSKKLQPNRHTNTQTNTYITKIILTLIDPHESLLNLLRQK